MEPVRDAQVTLVDLLDRVLDKGLVINADIIISVAGIPLIGVNLRAALAGMETMLKYGVMKAWDQRIRAHPPVQLAKKEISSVSKQESKEELVFLREREAVTHQGKAWHMHLKDGVWKPGRLYITNKRLCWWHGFEKRLVFQVPTETILGSAVEVRNLSPVLKKKRVFDVIYKTNSKREVASFSGEGMYEWERALARIISFRERIEACPQCGKKAVVLELLDEGCSNCGWVSPKLKTKLAQVAK